MEKFRIEIRKNDNMYPDYQLTTWQKKAAKYWVTIYYKKAKMELDYFTAPNDQPTAFSVLYNIFSDVYLFNSCADVATFIYDLGYTSSIQSIRDGLSYYEFLKKEVTKFKLLLGNYYKEAMKQFDEYGESFVRALANEAEFVCST